MELREAILSRRSVRKFTDTPIPKEDLRDIVLAGMNAPSACNSQCWKFVVLTQKSQIEDIAKVLEVATREYYQSVGASEELVESRVKLTTFFKKAPAVIFVFKTDMQYHDSRVTTLFTEGLGYSHRAMVEAMGNPEELSIGACVQNMLLAAQEKGLGACWQCDPVLFGEDIAKALGITDAKLASVVPVGVPAQTPREKAIKPFEEACTIL